MIQLEESRFAHMLAEAAKLGAERAMYEGTLYTKQQACERLRISYNTLQKRIRERKLYEVDGRIPGRAIRAYLAEKVGNG